MEGNIEVKKKGKPTTNNVAFEKIRALEVGQYLIITKKEWAMSTIPGAHLIRRRLNREFLVETLSDDSGWKITALPAK